MTKNNNVKIIVQLSTGEKNRAIKRGHEMEMNLSQYIRHLIWCDTVRVVANVTEDDRVIGQMPNGVPIVSTGCPHPPEAQQEPENV